MLAKERAKGLNLVVLIGPRESRQDTRDQLDDMELTDLAFYQDESGDLYESAKIKVLPSIFLLNDRGSVEYRIVGFQMYQLNRLLNSLKEQSDDDDDDDA